MAQSPRDRKPSTASKGSKLEVLVDRDASFIRIPADDVVPSYRKSGMLLSFFARGKRPAAFGMSRESSIRGSKSVQPIRFEPFASELACINLPHAAAFNLAMRLIDFSIREGLQTPDFVQEAIAGIFERYKDKEEGGSEQGDAESAEN